MRKKYKNQLFNVLLHSTPDISKWKIEESQENENIYNVIISYGSSPLKFIIRCFHNSSDVFDYKYINYNKSFTLSSTYPYGRIAKIDDLEEGLQKWIKSEVLPFIEDEEALDLWDLYNRSNKSIDFTNINFEDKSNFLYDEKQQVRLAINELKHLIQTNFQTDDEEQKIVNDRLDYLIDAVDRLNKFDWKGTAVSTLMSISIALSLDTSKGQQLFELFKQVISNLPQLTQ